MNSWSAVALVLAASFVAVQVDVTSGAPATAEEPAFLVISFDGFKPEYFNRNVTPNLNKIRRDGLTAPFLLNVFPTKTFVNHHTISTVIQLAQVCVVYTGRSKCTSLRRRVL